MPHSSFSLFRSAASHPKRATICSAASPALTPLSGRVASLSPNFLQTQLAGLLLRSHRFLAVALLLVSLTLLSAKSSSWTLPAEPGQKESMDPSSANSALGIITDMLDAIQNTQQLSYKMKAWERFGKDLVYSESDVRMQMKPFKIYMKTWAPESGIEILYGTGERDGLALIKPAGFPYVNVKLAPSNSRMRDGQHHTILEGGFLYFGSIIRRSLEMHRDKLEEVVTLEDGQSFLGRPCYMLTIDYQGYSWNSYTLKSGETLLSVARREGLPEHSILERNPAFSSYESGKAGQRLNIPTAYAFKTVLYIDKQTLLPIKKMIYDDRGLYERYEFHYLNTSPKLGNEAFSADNPEYGF
ncbi:MAG: DUF1571 domain-containing protein [Bacteroidetes bacterium]|nr:DUF1571 domain-containing protein [Bacteroidota bacterium]